MSDPIPPTPSEEAHLERLLAGIRTTDPPDPPRRQREQQPSPIRLKPAPKPPPRRRR